MNKLKNFDDLFSDESFSEDENKKLFSDQEKPEETISHEKEAELTAPPDTWKVLIVDDEEDIHAVTRMALKGFTYRGKGIEFYDAYTGKEAEKILKEHPDIALILLDVVMESNQAGLELVKTIREKLGNHVTQIIIRTGQPGQAPEREVIVSYEINDYKTKTELTSFKLFTVALASLRAYDSLRKVDQLNEEFKKEITERIRIEKRLIYAKEKAEKSDRLKSEFIYQMSEDIKKPLGVIINSSDLIKEEVKDKVDEGIKDLFERMNYSGKRIIRTLQLILDMSEIYTGSYEIKPGKIDVLKIIKEVSEESTLDPEKKNLEIQIRKNTENTKTTVDEYSIKQVLDNLTDNAVKFTDKGKVEIKLSRNNKDELIIEISDTGVGISKDFIPEMFKPFTQERTGFDHKYNGIGLGLALTKAYCKLNKLNISVESKKGKGSVFKLVFP